MRRHIKTWTAIGVLFILLVGLFKFSFPMAQPWCLYSLAAFFAVAGVILPKWTYEVLRYRKRYGKFPEVPEQTRKEKEWEELVEDDTDLLFNSAFSNFPGNVWYNNDDE